jgi:hypothetical protein
VRERQAERVWGEGQRSSEEAGWKRSNPKWWLGNGQSLRVSEKPFRVASSDWEQLAVLEIAKKEALKTSDMGS